MQRKRITDEWNEIAKKERKKHQQNEGAREKNESRSRGKKRMFPIFIAYFESVARERRKKKNPNRKTCFFFNSLFSSPSISSIWSNILLIFLFGSLALRCMRVCAGVRLMINSISVLFPFKYFIPFRPFAHHKECVHNRKTNFLFLPTSAKENVFQHRENTKKKCSFVHNHRRARESERAEKLRAKKENEVQNKNEAKKNHINVSLCDYWSWNEIMDSATVEAHHKSICRILFLSTSFLSGFEWIDCKKRAREREREVREKEREMSERMRKNISNFVEIFTWNEDAFELATPAHQMENESNVQ